MQFTYDAYKQLIELLRSNSYEITNYHDCDAFKKCAILRHDIDTSLEKAAEMAKLEYNMGVKSTYFVLLGTRFYNVAERKHNKLIEEILNYGHEIGLHFDEQNYETGGGVYNIESLVLRETEMLSTLLDKKIMTVSMHRPSKETLNADYEFSGKIINSYGSKFFNDYKYISDSRRRWRENAEEIIKSGEYSKLHILTHAFWYNEVEEDIETSITKFIKCGNVERYDAMKENITDLESIVSKNECCGVR